MRHLLRCTRVTRPAAQPNLNQPRQARYPIAAAPQVPGYLALYGGKLTSFTPPHLKVLKSWPLVDL